MPAVAATIYI